jgi:hypothetical protein
MVRWHPAARIGNYSMLRRLLERGAHYRQVVLMTSLDRFRACRGTIALPPGIVETLLLTAIMVFKATRRPA